MGHLATITNYWINKQEKRLKEWELVGSRPKESDIYVTLKGTRNEKENHQKPISSLCSKETKHHPVEAEPFYQCSSHPNDRKIGIKSF